MPVCPTGRVKVKVPGSNPRLHLKNQKINGAQYNNNAKNR